MKIYPLFFALFGLFALINCSKTDKSKVAAAPSTTVDVKAKFQVALDALASESGKIYKNRREYTKILQDYYKDHPDLMAEMLDVKGLFGKDSTNFPFGVGLMAAGVVLAFFGRRMFRVFLTLSGFVIGASSFFYAAVRIESLLPKNYALPEWAFWLIGIIGGLLGSLLFTKAWKWGTYILSAYGGVMFSFWLIGIIPAEYAVKVNATFANVVFAILGVVAAHYVEEMVLICSSAMIGGFLVALGIDYLHSVGFRAFIKRTIIDNPNPDYKEFIFSSVSDNNVTICMLIVLVITVAGAFIQFRNRADPTDLN